MNVKCAECGEPIDLTEVSKEVREAILTEVDGSRRVTFTHDTCPRDVIEKDDDLTEYEIRVSVGRVGDEDGPLAEFGVTTRAPNLAEAFERSRAEMSEKWVKLQENALIAETPPAGA